MKNQVPRSLTQLPIPINKMVGRRRELVELQQSFQTERPIVLLNGLGGMGKTSLANAFLHQEKENYDHLAWVPFQGSLQESMINAFNPHFQFKGTHEEVYLMIRAELKELPGKKLVILDNFNQFDEVGEINEVLSNSKVLITSRYDLDLESIPIDSLSFRDAEELFLMHCEREVAEDSLQELFELVGYHTLMIEILAKTYTLSQVDLEGLVVLLTGKNSEEETQTSPKKQDNAQQGERKILAHLSALFEHASLNQKEIFFLQQFSILASTEELFASDLLDIFKIRENKKEDHLVVLEQLAKKGWLRQTGEVFYCHEVIRTFVLNSPIRPLIQNCRKSITYFIEKLEDENNYRAIDKAPLIPHAASIVKTCSTDSPEVALLSEKLAISYRIMGKPKKAVKYLEQVLKRELIHDNQSLKVATLYRELGKSWMKLAEYSKAEDFYKKSLSIHLKHYDSECSEIANDWLQLGEAQQYLAKYDEAIQYYKQSLASNIKIYGEDHPKVAESKEYLGNTWRLIGKYERAIEYYEQALAISLKVYGEEHPKTAAYWGYLGSSWKSLGKCDKAINYLEKALISDLRTYGKEHPDVFCRMHNLGSAWYFLEEHEKAIQYFEQSVAGNIKAYGEDHPSVSLTWNNLGMAYHPLKDYSNAIKYLELSLASDIKTFGKDHPDVAISLNNLGMVFGAMGEHEKGIDFLEQALAIFFQSYGEEHPRIAKAWNYLGEIFQKLEKTKKALQYYQQSVSLYQKLLGEQHPETKAVNKNLTSLKHQDETL